jgi:bile acid:Na+ symporter, BASS family
VIVAGLCLPQLGAMHFLIRPLLMGVLFFAFLKTPLRQVRVQRIHVQMLFVNISIPLLLWGLFYLVFQTGIINELPQHVQTLGQTFGLAAIIIAAAPTATASPAVVQMLGGNTALVLVQVLLSNAVMGGLLGVFLFVYTGASGWQQLGHILGGIAFTIGVPFVLAQVVVQVRGKLSAESVSYGLWMAALLLVSARSGAHIRAMGNDYFELAGLAGVAGLLCFALFKLGGLLGAREQRALEFSHGVGHKNTIFVIWVALEWLSPNIALGPILYVIWQNSIISHRLAKRSAWLKDTAVG